MYYILESDNQYDEVMIPLVKPIMIPCQNSEFQYLSREKQIWIVPDSQDFVFFEYYYIKHSVLVFSKHVWDRISALKNVDGIFTIPIEIVYCGERHSYFVTVPSRIRCMDYRGRILERNVGRYQMFKSNDVEDSNIYLTELLAQQLSSISTITVKGVN